MHTSKKVLMGAALALSAAAAAAQTGGSYPGDGSGSDSTTPYTVPDTDSSVQLQMQTGDFSRLDATSDRPLSVAEARTLHPAWRQLDVDGDGKISFYEFSNRNSAGGSSLTQGYSTTP